MSHPQLEALATSSTGNVFKPCSNVLEQFFLGPYIWSKLQRGVGCHKLAKTFGALLQDFVVLDSIKEAAPRQELQAWHG